MPKDMEICGVFSNKIKSLYINDVIFDSFSWTMLKTEINALIADDIQRFSFQNYGFDLYTVPQVKVRKPTPLISPAFEVLFTTKVLVNLYITSGICRW